MQLSRRLPLALCLAALVVCRIDQPRADSVVLTPVKDNTIYAESGSLSNGAGQFVFTGKNGGGSARRALLKFDLTAVIPPGALVTSVRLTLDMNQTSGGQQTIFVHRLLADWGEGSSAAGGGEGGGAAATAGDATWTNTFFPSAFWSSPGGDFLATASAGVPVNAIGKYTWSSPGMVGDVQGWVSSSPTNFGWILQGGEGPSSATAKRYASRNNSNSAIRPALCVGYCVGGCAGSVPDGYGVPGTPLRIAKAPGGDLTLTWGASCAVTDGDYEVYEGEIGDFSGHLPLECSTGGATSSTITPSGGNRFYLVVPRGATREGSYGQRSDHTERPPSATACLEQSIATCCF